MIPSITVDARAVREALRAFPTETNRALRNTLNDLARATQANIVAGAAERFDIRNQAFLRRSIYIGPEDRATKDKLEARVRTNPDRGDILGQFEAAGGKAPIEGKYLAVPGSAIRTTGGHVKPRHRFKDFMPFTEAGPSAKIRFRKGKVHRGRGATKTQLVGQKGSYWVRLRGSGLPALMQRKRGQDVPTLLYVLKPRVTLPKSLQFLETATRTVERQWEAITSREIDRALKRAGLT